MSALRHWPALLVTAALLFLMARGSAVTIPWHDPGASELRLSWTARPERLERCRTLSEEELEKLPAHMRQRVQCEGHFTSYQLIVTLDDSIRAQSVVRGGGFRHDRPLHLLESVAISPGTRHVRVAFARRESPDSSVTSVNADTSRTEPDTGLYEGRAEREAAARRERAHAAIAPLLVLDTTVVVAPASVVLITYDPRTGRLQLRDR